MDTATPDEKIHQAQSTHYIRPKRWGKVEIPDVATGETYLRRWYLLRFPRLFSIRLHHILLPDTDRDPHDHPWWFLTIILRGGYTEHWSRSASAPGWMWGWFQRRRHVKYVSFHHATDLHQIRRFDRGSAWTLFITGPEKRVWGFQTKDGWMAFQDYFDSKGWAG